MIKAIYESGLSNVVYYLFHVLGFLAVLLFNLWYGRKYGIKKVHALLTTVFVYSITYVWIYVLYWIEHGFKNFGGNNIVRGFVWIPLIAYPVAKWLKIEWRRMCDFIAPCACISQGVSHIGCVFAGCCGGYSSSWGIYNPLYKRIAFPVQLFEAFTALLIVFVIVYWAKRKAFAVDGLSFPLMLILFGFTRFLWEFERFNEKIWLGCSSLAFHALFMGIVGSICMAMICKRNRTTSKKGNEMRRKRR